MRIPALEPPLQDRIDPDVYFETGAEPEWAVLGRELPGRVLTHLPESIAAADPMFVLTEHGDSEYFHLSYSDGTRFVVDGSARRLWGTFQSPLGEEDLITYFLGPVMGFLLRRRHQTALHASCVQMEGCGIALCGEAGFGKSTTAAALAIRDFPVLSEDIVPIRESGDGFRVVPGYPRVCLWPDAVASLLGTAHALPQLTPVWEKRFLALDGDRARFCDHELPLGAIYILDPRSPEPSAPRVDAMSPREALLVLVQNTYMNWLLDREQRAVEFDVLARLVQRVPVRRLVPHSDANRIGELCSLLAGDARETLTTRS